MPGFASLYAGPPVGQHANGDPLVADLLTRTVENQYRATGLLDQWTAHAQSTAEQRWQGAQAEMSVFQSHWVSAMLWQMATAYLDGVVNHYATFEKLPQSVYAECDSLCDLASAATLQAIQYQGRLGQGASVNPPKLVSLPGLQPNGEGYAGVWRALEAVSLQVESDLVLANSVKPPRKMRPVLKAVNASVQPNLDSFNYLREQWRTTRVDENRRQIVANAISVVEVLFGLGQQLCAPPLLGAVYNTAINYVPTLAELELGFDPWVLTDPASRPRLLSKAASQRELAAFWESVEDPAVAWQIAEGLRQAHQDGAIRYRTGQGYQLVPWAAQYMVHRPLQFGGRSFVPGDLITVFVNNAVPGKSVVEVRRTGRLTSPRDQLGQ